MWPDVALPAALLAGRCPSSAGIAARLLPVLLPAELLAHRAHVRPTRANSFSLSGALAGMRPRVGGTHKAGRKACDGADHEGISACF